MATLNVHENLQKLSACTECRLLVVVACATCELQGLGRVAANKSIDPVMDWIWSSNGCPVLEQMIDFAEELVVLLFRA